VGDSAAAFRRHFVEENQGWLMTTDGVLEPEPHGEAVKLAARNADVLRRQADGSWRFVIDNPWGTD
jgi:ketosteroid isomerase-like protein